MAEEAGKSQLLVQEPRCPGPGVGALAAHSTAIPARGGPCSPRSGLRHRRLSDGPVSAALMGVLECAHAWLRVADRAHHHRRHSGPAGRTAASAGSRGVPPVPTPTASPPRPLIRTRSPTVHSRAAKRGDDPRPDGCAPWRLNRGVGDGGGVDSGVHAVTVQAFVFAVRPPSVSYAALDAGVARALLGFLSASYAFAPLLAGRALAQPVDCIDERPVVLTGGRC